MAGFIEINDENFESELGKVSHAIVDFYASWCGACRMAAPMFLKVADAAKIPIFKVDAEKNPKVKALVEISTLPTLALFKNGKPVASLSTTREEGLKSFLQENGISV